MSDEHRETPPSREAEAAPAAPPVPAADEPAAPPPAQRGGAAVALVWLAALLVVVVAGVAASPFWAPAVAPLLPWSTPPVKVDLDRIETRVAALEQRPAPPKTDLSGIEANQATLANRIDRLEKAEAPAQKVATAVTAAQADLQRLDRRVGKLESQIAAQKTDLDSRIDRLREEDAKLGTLAGSLADKAASLETQVHALAGADRKGAALLILLLQMREAVDRGQPFNADYRDFRSLTLGQPEFAAATAALAEAAQKGVATRSELADRLQRIADHVATATPPPADSDWRAQVLARLRSLVTIRRIGGDAQSGPEAAVANAQKALANGDLHGAIVDLAALTGAPAEAAMPWLKAARARLAAETALDHLQQMLVTRLAAPPPRPAAAPGNPSATPANPAATPASPADAPANPAGAPAKPAGAPANPAGTPAKPASPS